MVRSTEQSRCYAEWRRQGNCLTQLREGPVQPSEHLLQAVWQHQRLQRDRLRLSDSIPLVVLHPGFWNHESGPDFHQALIQLGTDRPLSGDVEIDPCPADWHRHGHDRNPAFQQVILHVAWSGAAIPGKRTLLMEEQLDAPVEELLEWINTESLSVLPEALQGRCAQPLRRLPPSMLQEILQQAALVRLEGKARQLQARARQTGWDQALWEALFRGLGYKHNVWPMQRLGELRPHLETQPGDLMARQAQLIGAAGLLPELLPVHRPATARYLRGLWDYWWRERQSLGTHLLPQQLWRFDGLRPANRPERRLALAAHWLGTPGFIGRLEAWGLSARPARDQAAALLEILQPPEDAFWSWHWTLRSKAFRHPQPLIGPSRVTDLAINAVLPWLWIRAAEGRNPTLQETFKSLYLDWPAGEDNAMLKLARQRLLGTQSPRVLPSAFTQQGLLQILRDFCAHSNALCADCQFPNQLARAGLLSEE